MKFGTQLFILLRGVCTLSYVDVIQELELANPEAVLLDGFDEALVGLALSYSSNIPVAAYSVSKIIHILKEENGMSEDAALEYFEYNLFGGYFGEYSPVFIQQP